LRIRKKQLIGQMTLSRKRF